MYILQLFLKIFLSSSLPPLAFQSPFLYLLMLFVLAHVINYTTELIRVIRFLYMAHRYSPHFAFSPLHLSMFPWIISLLYEISPLVPFYHLLSF